MAAAAAGVGVLPASGSGRSARSGSDSAAVGRAGGRDIGPRVASPIRVSTSLGRDPVPWNWAVRSGARDTRAVTGRVQGGVDCAAIRSSVPYRGRTRHANLRSRFRHRRPGAAPRRAVARAGGRPSRGPAGHRGPVRGVARLARPEAPGRAREARDRAAVHPPGRRDRGRARGRGRRGGDPHRVGQVAVLHGAGAPVAGGGSVGPRAVPVPHQGPRPGPGRGAVGARPRRRPRGLERRLRRRHAGADPLGDPQGRAGRRDQPGHAPLGDPPPPHEVVPAVRAAAGHRHRRAPHVPRRVRQPRRQRAPAAAAAVRPLREPPRDRVLLRDDREPVGARRDARRPPRPDDRSQRRARRREAPAAGRSAGHRRVDRGAGVGADAGRAMGAAVPPRGPADRGLRAVPRVRRDHALEHARGAADGPRSALATPRLPGGLPADRAALDRARAPRRRGPRGRQHQRPRAGRGHRGARRGGARRLPGLDRRDVAADGARRAPGRRQHRDPRRVTRARRPVRHPPPGVPAGQRAGGGAPRPRQPPRAARPPARGGVRAAVRAGRRRSVPSRRTGCSPSWARVARSGRPTTVAGTGARRTSPPRRSRSGRRRPRTS